MNPAAMEVTGYHSLEEIKDKPLHYAVHWKKPDGSHYPMEECPIDNAQAQLKKFRTRKRYSAQRMVGFFRFLIQSLPWRRMEKLSVQYLNLGIFPRKSELMIVYIEQFQSEINPRNSFYHYKNRTKINFRA